MKNVTLKIAGIGIFITQLLDIVIHAATDQLEPIRVSSNIIIFLWLVIVVSGKLKEKSLLLAVASIVVYFILNIIFLSIEGVTNAEQGGGLRVALFVLVFVTLTLSSLFAYLRGRSTTEKN